MVHLDRHINFAASANTASSTFASEVIFATGDRLAIINESPADVTLADLSITFLGRRT